MIYRAIGVMSGSSMDGLDIAYTELTETGGKWSYELIATNCLVYQPEWIKQLTAAAEMPAKDYLLLNTAYGHYIGNKINDFIETNDLQHRVNLVASHGHTIFHFPDKKMTAQLGDGASIAAEIKLPVVSDLRSIDIAFGGQGAPIVPIGEKLLFGDYTYLLNLGGIANISINKDGNFKAFDICVANKILNVLAAKLGLDYDAEGKLAQTGIINELLLQQLNTLVYYKLSAPKALDNSFGTNFVLPIIERANLTPEDALATYTGHIIQQICTAILNNVTTAENSKLLVTGGGAFNTFLVKSLIAVLLPYQIEVVVPDADLVKFKEALIMALIGVLRWREETNVLASVTGAAQNSIGGALWLGTEA